MRSIKDVLSLQQRPWHQAVGLLWFLPNLWQAPTLLALQHTHDGQNINWTVPSQAGQYTAPAPGLSVSGWTVAPGATLSGAEPPDRVVRFYVIGRDKPKLLCLVDVRYFPYRGGWAPYYRLDEQMFFTHRGGRWMPLTLLNGVPSFVTATPIGFANAAGYYRAFTFSQSTGPISLAGWSVGVGQEPGAHAP